MTYMDDFETVRIDTRPIDMSIYDKKGENFERFGIIERKY
jgi:hypothetical protein